MMTSFTPPTITFFICLMTAWVGSVYAQTSQPVSTIEFRQQDQVIKSLHPEELGTVTNRVILTVFEVHERRERQYSAYSARSILDQVFGQRWRTADEIIFSCRDGYQPAIPVAKFLAYDAYFAVANADNSPFMLDNILQNHETVELGPVYLIWDNRKFPVLLEEGASDMPYQIIGVELASFAARFPEMFPSAPVSAEVKRGFLHFRKYCMACHTMNGQGGSKAPELNYPVSVTEYFKPEYLRRWIDDPASLRFNTLMPALAAAIPKREQVIEEIIAYLAAMRTVKPVSSDKNSGK